jgi:hypothetical protein
MRLDLPSEAAFGTRDLLTRWQGAVGGRDWSRSRVRELLEGAGWVLVTLVASRLLIFGLIVFSKMVMVPAGWWHPGGLMSILTQWDGDLWYIQIARHGYHIRSGDHFPHGFFPLYPLLIRLTSIVFRDLRVAALVTSHLCLLLAGLFLNALVRIDYKDPRVSRAAVAFFMFSPVSFFFSSAYSESTFFMFATAALLAARKDRWLVACLCGMCLSAARPPGVLIGIPLFIEAARRAWDTRRSWRMIFDRRILLLAIVPLGLGSYMVYEWVAFGDPFAFSHAAAIWGRSFTSPVQTLLFLKTYTLFYFWFFLGTLVVTLLIIAGGLLLRIRASYLAYCAALTLIYLCSATFEALPRYVSVEFPLFIILGLVATRYRWTYEPLFTCSVALLTLCTIMSGNGYWLT